MDPRDREEGLTGPWWLGNDPNGGGGRDSKALGSVHTARCQGIGGLTCGALSFPPVCFESPTPGGCLPCGWGGRDLPVGPENLCLGRWRLQLRRTTRGQEGRRWSCPELEEVWGRRDEKCRDDERKLKEEARQCCFLMMTSSQLAVRGPNLKDIGTC